MKRTIAMLALPAAMLTLGACEETKSAGPPQVRLGDSVCAQCNMIISDERWATATMVDGPRGPEARLFDDLNCQVDYETDNPDLTIRARWSHNHATRAWLPTESARFLMSPNLRTPMGSQVAVFASAEEANQAKAELSGEVMTFDIAWNRLGSNETCCHTE